VGRPLPGVRSGSRRRRNIRQRRRLNSSAGCFPPVSAVASLVSPKYLLILAGEVVLADRPANAVEGLERFAHRWGFALPMQRTVVVPRSSRSRAPRPLLLSPETARSPTAPGRARDRWGRLVQPLHALDPLFEAIFLFYRIQESDRAAESGT
jgi:hypothetical protein